MKPTSDLEALIRQLAGRDEPEAAGDSRPTDRSENQLNDPSSDPSRFLDEIRRRTRSLFDEPTGAERDPAFGQRSFGFNPLFAPGIRLTNRLRLRSGWLIIAVSLIAGLAVFGELIWQAADRSMASRSGEQTERIITELQTRFPSRPENKLPTPSVPDPSAANNELAMRRLEVELASLNAKLDALGRSITLVAAKTVRPRPDSKEGPASPIAPMVAAPDPNYPVISADLAAIRRELVNSEAATTRQIQEMRTVLQEVNTVVRRVLSRPQPSSGNGVAYSVLAVAVQALINNLQHSSAQVRGEAVEQLARIGAPARSAIPALQQLLGRETDPNIRSAIETALSILSSN